MSEPAELPSLEEIEEPQMQPEEHSEEQAPEKAPKSKKLKFFAKDGKYRPGAKMRAAIFEIIGKKRIGLPPEYKLVAAKHWVKDSSLKKMVWQHGKGQIDISDPPNILQKKELDLRVENERSLRNIQSYEALLNDTFEAQLRNARKDFDEGDVEAIHRSNISKTLSEISSVRRVRVQLEKGVMVVLEQLIAMQNAKELAERTPAAATLVQNNFNVTMPSTPKSEAGPATSASQIQRAEIELSAGQIAIHEILGALRETER